MSRESRKYFSSAVKMNPTTLIIFLVLLSVCFCCQIQKESNSVVCASLEELYLVDSPQPWVKIIVKSSETGKTTSLNASAFQNVPKVKEINIVASNLQTIQPGTFDNLPEIEIISIIGNEISTIQSKVFTKLPVKELTLTDNKIQFIENRAFAEMEKLKTLKLNKNELTTFDTKLLLGKASVLELLVLSRNNLKSLSKDIFEGLTNLKSLYLNNNQLDTLQNNCFKSLKSIEILDISTNYIKEISPNFFPDEGTRTLTNFHIHNNQLCFMHPEVFQRLPNIRKFSYGGNPWQCPCWELLDKWITDKNITRVCHEEHAAGQRPECIVTDFAPTECVYDKEKLNEVPKIFLSETKEYEKIEGCLVENY